MSRHSLRRADLASRTLWQVLTCWCKIVLCYGHRIRRPLSSKLLVSKLTAASTSNFPSLPEIIAPTPRRHLIESSVAQHWLHTGTPPLSGSPGSSRATSPVSASASAGRMLHHQMSFSSMASSSVTVRPTRVKATEKADPNGDAGMGRRWVRWMHKRGIRHWVVPGAILAATLVKAAIGLGSYSGMLRISPLDILNLIYGHQGRAPHQCSVTMRRRGTGWNSQSTCLYFSGIRTTYRTGAWTIHR